MTPERLCQQLIQTVDIARRNQALAQAVAMPDFGAWLESQARSALPTEPQRALTLAELAREIAEARQDPRAAVNAERGRGQALRLLRRHAEAIVAFDAAAAQARLAGDDALAAQARIGSIDSLGLIGRADEAFALAQTLETELRARGLETDAAKVLVNAGNLHFRRDAYLPALHCYERALTTLTTTGDEMAVAFVRANCANILTSLDRIDEALALFAQARDAFLAQEMGYRAAMVDADEAYLRYISGEHTAALGLYARARQEFTTHDFQLEAAKCDAEMADVYRSLNLAPEAIECYERVIAFFAEVPLDYERACAELGLAQTLSSLSRTEEAFAALERADSLFRAQNNRLQRVHGDLLRAGLLRATGRSEEASALALAASRTLSAQKLPGWAAEARFLVADIALESEEEVREVKEVTAAITSSPPSPSSPPSENAVRQMQSVRNAAARYARLWLKCRAEHALGRYYQRQNAPGRALRHLRQAVADLEQARAYVASEELHVAFLRDKLPIYEDFALALLARGRRQDIAEALEAVERSKSRLLLERLQTALQTRATPAVSEEERNRLTSLRAELSRAYHRVNTFDESSPQRRIGVEPPRAEAVLALERAYHNTLRDIEMRAALPASSVPSLAAVLPVTALQAALSPEETLIEYAIIGGEVCAFVVTSCSIQVRRNLAHLDDIAYANRRLRYHLQRAEMLDSYLRAHSQQLHTAIRDVLQRLHAHLLAPLEPLLATEKLVIVPHGILHGLPFHAFYDGEQFALDRYEFSYAPSAAIWHQSAQSPALEGEARDLLFGVPDAGLTQVATEIANLTGLLPKAEVYCNEQANIATFRERATRCRLLHLATHALYRADNPLFSGLRFADGWLLARDLYTLRMDCDLVTLAACRTGATQVEPGDELFGLVRGFLSAGARSLAVSLWPADDAATAAMMTRFYTLLQDGNSYAAAMRTAQRELRESYPHPYHWAAFALIGKR